MDFFPLECLKTMPASDVGLVVTVTDFRIEAEGSRA